MQTAHMQLWFPQYPQLLFISGAAPPQVSVRPRPVRLLPCVRPGKSIECCPFAMSVCVAPISACQRSVFDIRCARRSCVLASSVRVIRAMVLEYAARGAGFAKNLLLCLVMTPLVLDAAVAAGASPPPLLRPGWLSLTCRSMVLYRRATFGQCKHHDNQWPGVRQPIRDCVG